MKTVITKVIFIIYLFWKQVKSGNHRKYAPKSQKKWNILNKKGFISINIIPNTHHSHLFTTAADQRKPPATVTVDDCIMLHHCLFGHKIQSPSLCNCYDIFMVSYVRFTIVASSLNMTIFGYISINVCKSDLSSDVASWSMV